MSVVVLISANTEWRVTLPLFPKANVQPSPLGDWFETKLEAPKRDAAIPITPTGLLRELGYRVVFFHGGWGKIGAAASAQYIVDRWRPSLLINLGTCGGFQGSVERGEILLVNKTLVYDIVEQMTDPDEALAKYTTDLDLSWVREPYPQPVRRTLLVSGDRDLIASEAPMLKERFGAVAGDWESGAIAWVAARNGIRCLILRGVSDLVGADGGEAYDDGGQFFAENAVPILKSLVEHLPEWIAASTHARER